MNRREMIAAIGASVATGATISTIEPEPIPLMIVVTLPVGPTFVQSGYDDASKYSETWVDAPNPMTTDVFIMPNGEQIPVIYVTEGTKVEAVIDPRGK